MIEPIADAGDRRLDDYRSLNDQAFRRRYEADRIFVAEGFVAIDRLIDSGHIIGSVLMTPSRLDRFGAARAELERRGVPVFVASREVVGEVVGFDLHRGVVAVAERRPPPTIADIAASSRRVAVLEGLNDAENLGAIARAARALGIDALVTDPRCTDPYSRRSVRVSMGEILLLAVVPTTEQSWPSLFAELDRVGFESWALTPARDAANIWELAVPDRLAVVLGAEGPGLEEPTMRRATRRVRIPIRADVDSLNVGHAAAVAFAAIDR